MIITLILIIVIIMITIVLDVVIYITIIRKMSKQQQLSASLILSPPFMTLREILDILVTSPVPGLSCRRSLV